MHRINRLEIEVQTQDVTLARALSARASRMYERLLPVLEHACDTVGSSEIVRRLECVELDLGALSADDFEESFLAKVGPALSAALAGAIRREARHEAGRTALDLVETFALTGGLPWWADGRDTGIIARQLMTAATEAPGGLLALLQRLGPDAGAIARLARMIDSDALGRLCTHLNLADRWVGSSVAERAETLLSLASPAGARANPILESAPQGERRVTAALRLRLPGDEARSCADSVEDRASVVSDSAPDAEARLAGSDLPETDAESAAQAPLSSGSDALAMAAQPDERTQGRASAGEPVRSGESAPSRLEKREVLRPSPGLDNAASAFATARARDELDPSRLAELPPTDREAGEHAVRPAAPNRHTAMRPGEQDVASSRMNLKHGTRPLQPGHGPETLSSQPTQAVRRAALARLDELYVDNGGLVILWPFLERFFTRVDLLGKDRHFRDQAATWEAIWLLHQLASGDLEWVEFQLPLAKLLCGSWPDADFDPPGPPAPEKIAESENLLTAVIEQVPAFGKLTISGLRTTFLQRRAALSTRDGTWLLQVERQAQDILLDRCPWSWGWVKLPWMAHPLRVEW